jgi:hypothetical protein
MIKSLRIYCFFAIWMSLLPNNCFSQKTLGIFAGDNINSLISGQNINASIGCYNSIHFGLFYRRPISKSFYIDHELNFIEKGYSLSWVNINPNDTNIVIRNQEKYQYIEYKPLLEWMINEYISISAGPYLCVQFHESGYFGVLGFAQNKIFIQTESKNSSFGADGADYGLNIGLNYKISNKVFLRAGFEQGLDKRLFSGLKIYNESFLFTAYYKLYSTKTG